MDFTDLENMMIKNVNGMINVRLAPNIFVTRNDSSARKKNKIT